MTGAVVRLATLSLAMLWSVAATAQTEPAPAPPRDPDWIVTLSTGLLARDGDASRAFVVAGASRKVGRGYVRIAGTRFRSVVQQLDTVALPSTFTIGSLGAGGTFGRWFVDGYVSAGRQEYGGVTTPLGTRPSTVGSGSGVFGATLSGGRFIALSPAWYLTPSIAAQYSSNRSPRTGFGPTGPLDFETRERAWTGSATLRLDRFFGPANRHIVGLSVTRVATSNGATILAAGAPGLAGTSSLADGYFVLGGSGSLRLSPRLWLDGSATRTVAARTGDYRTLSLGVRVGF